MNLDVECFSRNGAFMASPPREKSTSLSPTPRLPASADDALTLALKRMHSSIAEEPLPADLQAIVDQIDASIAARDGQS